MSKSMSPEALGSTCKHCGRVMVPPDAIVTREGRVLCRVKLWEQQQKWLARKLAQGTLRREATS